MNKAKVGKIVKFRDAEGRLNGGLIKDLVRENNVEYAIVNTLESEEVKVKKSDLILVNRQQRGRVSARFLGDLRDEIERENSNAPLVIEEDMTSSVENERCKGTKGSQQKIIKKLELKLAAREQAIKDYKVTVERFQTENERLRGVTAGSQPLLNQENLILTIKGLNNALLAASINKEGDMVLELTTVISKLNGIEI